MHNGSNVFIQRDESFFHDHGSLHMPRIFSLTETDTLVAELDWQIDTWVGKSPGWGRLYMSEAIERRSKRVA